LVAHLHFLPTHKPTLKNAKELPSQRTTTRQQNTKRTERKGTTANKGICKSWADGNRVSTFCFSIWVHIGQTNNY